MACRGRSAVPSADSARRAPPPDPRAPRQCGAQPRAAASGALLGAYALPRGPHAALAADV
eukprot:448594-Prymnesium_polylepis.1